VAHKRFDHENWNITDQAQRKRMITILEDMAAQLKSQLEPSETHMTQKVHNRLPSKNGAVKKTRARRVIHA
jgi:hypothetical protein